MFTYKAEIKNVVDGDTVDVSIDLGFDSWRVERLRLFGIDTPETSTPLGRAVKKLLADALTDKKVTITTYKPDKYGRYLAEVWLATNGLIWEDTTINRQLVKHGLAKAYFGATKSNLWTPDETAQVERVDGVILA